MTRVISILALCLALCGCETFRHVEDDILHNASNACEQAETTTP